MRTQTTPGRITRRRGDQLDMEGTGNNTDHPAKIAASPDYGNINNHGAGHGGSRPLVRAECPSKLHVKLQSDPITSKEAVSVSALR